MELLAKKKKKIILHIGMQKAGSKALQSAALNSKYPGLCFPESGRAGGFWHKDIFSSDSPEPLLSAAKEIPEAGLGMFSYEEGYLCSDERIREFGNLNANISTFMLIRDPLPWLHSTRNQVIKSWSTTFEDIRKLFDGPYHCINSFRFSEFCPKWQSVSDEFSLFRYDQVGDVAKWFYDQFAGGGGQFDSAAHKVNLALNSEGIKVFVRIKSMSLESELQREVCRVLQRDFWGLLFERSNEFRFYSRADAEIVREYLEIESQFLRENFDTDLNLQGRGGSYWSFDRLLNEPLLKESETALAQALDEASRAMNR